MQEKNARCLTSAQMFFPFKKYFFFWGIIYKPQKSLIWKYRVLDDKNEPGEVGGEHGEGERWRVGARTENRGMAFPGSPAL